MQNCFVNVCKSNENLITLEEYYATSFDVPAICLVCKTFLGIGRNDISAPRRAVSNVPPSYACI